MNDRLDEGRGNEADYVLGTVLGWDAFEVVRWHATEELSTPYEYDITLRRRAAQGPVDLDDLLDTGATFRIATEQRWRAVHGIIAEAEEVDRTSTLFYYRVQLVPPTWRMRHRRRCRTFVHRTLKEVLTCTLENRPYPGGEATCGLLGLSGDIDPPETNPSWDAFQEPHGRYAWRVTDEKRINHKDLHKFVAQYNESDFDFVARLLEHEGITYYFEHARDAAVMVLTDAPGQDALHESDKKALFRGGGSGGAQKKQELVRWLRDARRMRSRAVTMREYDYRRSTQIFDAHSGHDEADRQALGHFEYPARDEQLEDKIGVLKAELRLARFEVEKRLRQGMSTVRTLLPGHALGLRDTEGLRDDEDLLVVRAETFATQHGMEGSLMANEPFGFNEAGQDVGGLENRFVVLPGKLRFVPEKRERGEKIWGVQVARVWGPDTTVEVDEGDKARVVMEPVDIHCDEMGRVMIRLPWDTRNCQDGRPASDWCRVAQPWAGSRYGAMHVPRVGHEVLVSYENGDPDRPVIVGSVYTPTELAPPYDTRDAVNKTRTTIKSNSTNVTGAEQGSNELRFTDYKTKEEIYLHAEKDLNEVVENDHSTSVGGNQSNTVGGNQSNTVHQNRSHTVDGTEAVHVKGDRTTRFDANESHAVGVDRSTTIGSVERLEVGSSRAVIVHGPDMAVVDGDDVTQVGGARTVQVGGDHDVQTDASYRSKASANHTFDSTNMYITQSGELQVNATSLWLNVGGGSLKMSAGSITLDNGAGATIMLAGGAIFVVSGVIQTLSGADTNIEAGGNINSVAATINSVAATIHLNG